MDDINIVPCDDFAEVMITLHVFIPALGGLLHPLIQTLGIDITERQQPTGHRHMGGANPAATDDRTSQFVRRSRLSIQPQHTAGHDGNGC